MREEIKKFLENEGITLPKDFVIEVYSQILKIAGGPLAGLIQRGSKEAGKVAAKSLMKSTNLDKNKLPEILKDFFSLAGFGDMDIQSEGNIIKIQIKESFLLKAHQDPKKALSPLVGAIEGFVSEFLGKDIKVSMEDKNIYINL